MKRVKKGDGHSLKKYQFWHVFTHSLFHIVIKNKENRKTMYAIKSSYFADEPKVDLYREGKHVAYSKLPAVFPIENGVLEISSGGYGINRIHYATEKDESFSVYPDRRSIRGLRMWVHKQFPLFSRVIGGLAAIVLLVSLALSIPQLIETISDVPWVTENVGTFTSPITLSIPVNAVIFGAGALAGFERALMLRSHWLIDMETSGWESD